MDQFIAKHADAIEGTLSCFDRLIFRGYLPFFSGYAIAAFLESKQGAPGPQRDAGPGRGRGIDVLRVDFGGKPHPGPSTRQRVLFVARDPGRHYNRGMLAERPLPKDLDDRIGALVRTWRADPDLAAIYLFGSRAGGQGGPRSDVDLAVVLREELDADARWRKRLALLSEASKRLGTEALDLIVLEDAPTPLGHRVLKHGRLLSDTQPRRRATVAERILRQYLDEAYLRRVLDAGLADRLRERRFAR
jgi:predicted nucleotidyltransferase